MGNRISKAAPDGMVLFQYDPLYRLTQALSSTPGYSGNSTGKGSGIANATQQQKEFYSYDPVGNRLSSDRNTAYLYNKGNQLVSDGGTYAYDKNGNLIQKVTSDGTTAYAWDYENRLVKVTGPNGTVTEFGYDPFDRRISKKVNQGTAGTTVTRYYYDDESLILEYDEAGLVVNKYVHGPGVDEPVAVTTLGFYSEYLQCSHDKVSWISAGSFWLVYLELAWLLVITLFRCGKKVERLTLNFCMYLSCC